MSDTSSRILQLLALLQNHRYWAGESLAERLSVSPRTLRRDIERLRSLGYAIESNRGVDGGYQLIAGNTMPPLQMDNDEAVALVVGLHAAAHAGVGGLAETAVRALTKVLQSMTAEQRRQVDGLVSATTWTSPRGGDDGASPVTLQVVSQACRDQTRICFGYNSREQVASERTVEPYRLVTNARRWYLVAFDPDRNDWRTFRADRMTDARPLRNTFTPRPLPSDDLGQYVKERIEHTRPSYDVVVRIEQDIEALRAKVGRGGRLEAIDADATILHLTIDSLGFLVMILDQLHADFTVIQPPEVIDYLSNLGSFLARNTDPLRGTRTARNR
jgi:predicted DNA-binding transcriptional regulator YafY